MRKIIPLLVKLLVGVAILLYLFRSLDIHTVFQLTKDINYFWVFVAFMLIISLRFLMALRWRSILHCYGMNVSMNEVVRIVFISSSLGQVLPAGVGTDIVRGYQLNKSQGRVLDITATILIDRFIGVFSMGVVAMLGGVIGQRIGIPLNLVYTLTLFNLALILTWYFSGYLRPLLINIRLFTYAGLQKLRKLVVALTNLQALKPIVPQLFLVSVLVQLVRCSVFYFLYLSFGQTIEIIYFIVFIPILYVLLTVPVSFGGLGIREVSLVYFFGMADVAPEVSVSVGLLHYVLHLGAFFPGLLLWFTADKRQGQQA